MNSTNRTRGRELEANINITSETRGVKLEPKLNITGETRGMIFVSFNRGLDLTSTRRSRFL